jgi:RHS repeat-associated protein
VLKETTGPNQQGGAPLLRATAATELNLRFPGQYFESEAGSFYNYFRSYQATTGRYTQADPIGLEGGWSRFGYASADSFDFVDPDGRIALPALAPLLPLIPAACNLSPGYRGLFDRDGGKMYIKPPRNAHDPHGGTGKADRSGWLQGSKMR